MKLLPTILSGGSGTRLWPLSRREFPKPFLPLGEEGDLFTQTLRRVRRLSDHLPPGARLLPPLAIGNASNRELLLERLPEGGRAVLEPVGRNTAPAATLAALLEPEAVLMLLPSDHLIRKVPPFVEALSKAVQLAAEGYWLTFGILPSRPETGFGYLQKGEEIGEGVFRLERFVEKPDLETARRYLESGDYFWNSGMFLFRADRWLEALQKLQPQMLRACQEAVERGRWEDRLFLPEEGAFARVPADSIDYAVMERLDEVEPGRALLLPLDVGWSDLGAFPAFWEVFPQDDRGNVRLGETLALGCRDSLLFGRDLLVAAVGIEELVVVATRDAVLVLPRTEAQAVREVVAELEREGREEVQRPVRESHPWGFRERLGEGASLYRIRPGGRLQLGIEERSKLIVLEGSGTLLLPDQRLALRRGEDLLLHRGATVESGSQTPLSLLLLTASV